MQTPGSQQAEPKLFRKANLRTLLLIITGLRKHCRVVGESMLPTLQQGDIVIYRQSGSTKITPNKGSIVVIKDPLEPSSLIVKRVYKKSELGIEVRGDNENNSIDSRQFGLINHAYLVGIVEQIIPKSA